MPITRSKKPQGQQSVSKLTRPKDRRSFIKAEHIECGDCIDVNDVSFRYGENSILEEISFRVNCGDYLGIIGPNGSGKTTLLKIILGLLKPSNGSVSIFGKPIARLLNKYEIGYVPQRATQSDWRFPATVAEVVESGRTARVGLLRSSTAKDKQAIDESMAITDIGKYKNRLIGQLSGGERQRVFIAKALASQPKVLILDEPTVGVDLESQEKFYSLLCELNKKHNLTVILVSHDIDVVAQEVKTILFLNKKIIAYGSPQDLLKGGHLERLYSNQMKFIVHQH